MLFKMIAIERAGQLNNTRYRQIYITQSRVLAEKVKEYFVKLTDSALEKPNSQELQTNSSSQPIADERGLLAYDDEDQKFDNLPERLSELKDEHFPLFITFDKVSNQ